VGSFILTISVYTIQNKKSEVAIADLKRYLVKSGKRKYMIQLDIDNR